MTSFQFAHALLALAAAQPAVSMSSRIELAQAQADLAAAAVTLAAAVAAAAARAATNAAVQTNWDNDDTFEMYPNDNGIDATIDDAPTAPAECDIDTNCDDPV